MAQPIQIFAACIRKKKKGKEENEEAKEEHKNTGTKEEQVVERPLVRNVVTFFCDFFFFFCAFHIMVLHEEGAMRSAPSPGPLLHSLSVRKKVQYHYKDVENYIREEEHVFGRYHSTYNLRNNPK